MALVRRGAARHGGGHAGREGALLATADGVLRMPAMDVPMHSSVGAGDAFLAARPSPWHVAPPLEALAWAPRQARPPSRAPGRHGFGAPMWRRASASCAA